MSGSQSRGPTRASSIYAGVQRVGGTGGLRFSQIDGAVLRSCVDAVVHRGDAVLFGRTSDGGALSVRVLSEGATECWYPSDASELQELLEGLTAIASA